jgi:phosphoadenosine phosphosulfate reductase
MANSKAMDEDMEQYLKKYQLPNEKRYYDPAKAPENRKSGIHL